MCERVRKVGTVKKVLIVGGGIGGLSTSIALRKAGVEVEVVEIHKEFNVYGVGLILPTNSIRALDHLGVAQEVLKYGATWKNWRFYDGKGNFLVDPETPSSDHIDYNGGISRRYLHHALYEMALEHGAVMKLGTTVEEIDDKGEYVYARLTDGTIGIYDLVIGADGTYSKVRKMIFPDEKVEFVGEAVWRYPFKSPPNFDRGVMYLGEKAKAGLVPMSKDTLYLFLVTAEPGNPWKPADQLDRLLREGLQEFGGLVGELREQITNPKDVIYRPIETIIVNNPWHKGRVLLIGDAAHATAPHLAQGAAMAIEDGIVLADILKEGLEISESLELFMKRRYERCKLVVDSSNLLVEWELMLENGHKLPDGANIPSKMDEVTLKLTEPILSSVRNFHD